VLAGSFAMHRLLLDNAQRQQSRTGKRPHIWWKSIAVFAIPVLALLCALGFHLQCPELKGLNFTGGLQLRNSLIALWIGLSIYTGAFIAEIVRSGILAVSRGQTEAAHALGLRPGQTMRLVVLPQALRIIVPPLIS